MEDDHLRSRIWHKNGWTVHFTIMDQKKRNLKHGVGMLKMAKELRRISGSSRPVIKPIRKKQL